jgi:hypothetical protein
MIRFVLGIFGAAFSAVTLGLVAAALGIGGLLFLYSHDLPDHDTLSSYAPATISRIYSREGVVVDEFATERRLFVAAEEIPDVVANAFVSAEDRNFWEHGGYDPRAMAAVLVEAVRTRGQNVRGASTITQQVMKNFLLDGSRTIERKVREIILAARIERSLSKERILELYLNEIFLGQNSYGVAAAAQTYFNAPLEELTLEQAAYLAALAAIALELPPGARLRPRHQSPELRAEGDVRERLYRPGGDGARDRCPAGDRAGRAYRALPRHGAAAELLHRRDPPPAVGRVWRGRFLHRGLCRAVLDGRGSAARGRTRAAPRAGKL